MGGGAGLDGDVWGLEGDVEEVGGALGTVPWG